MIILLSVCILYLNCCVNNLQNVTTSTMLTTNPDVNTNEAIKNPFFFQDNVLKVKYKARFTFPSKEIFPNEIDLLIIKVLNFENGTLYKLKINCNEDFGNQTYYDFSDRFNLGYFYVQKDKILLIKDSALDIDELKTEADILNKYKVVCQDEELKDKFKKNQKAWHEYILVDDNKREYYGYNNQIETGYYEKFVWEYGKGLVEYKSGFGAEREDIWLQLIIID